MNGRRVGSTYQQRRRRSSQPDSSKLSFGKLVSFAFNYINIGLRSMALQPTTGSNKRINVRRHRPDYQIVMIAGVLLMLGMIIIYSVSPALSQRLLGDYSENYFVYRQFINICIGLVGFFIASQIPMQLWKRVLPLMIFVSALVTVAMFIPGIGISQNGATRWIGVGPLSFQPVELMKITTLFYLAFFLGEKSDDDINDASKTALPVGLMLLGLSFLIVVVQRDLGTMMSIAAIAFTLLFIAETPLKHFGTLVGLMTVGAVLSIALFPHRIARFLTFLNPTDDLQGAGYHVYQALIAIGSGGFTGLGLGRSVQVYGYLPEAANDSIFAVWAEKFGFIGALVILGLFTFLLYRLYVLVRDGRDKPSSLVAAGIMVWFASHIAINIGAMLGLLPLTGITLPFISYGGSSLLFMLIALGIAFQLSRYTQKSADTQKFATHRNGGVNRTVRGRI